MRGGPQAKIAARQLASREAIRFRAAARPKYYMSRIRIINSVLASLAVLVIAAGAYGGDGEFAKIVGAAEAESGFSGVVLVASGGKIDYAAAVGMADRRAKTRITTNSKFRIASITKAFTAVLVMKLYEQGKIDLNATIGRYLPDYTGPGRDRVTIHQLLTYSSGIADDSGKGGMLPYRSPLTLDEFIERYCSGGLTFEPGSRSAYANTEYIILGKIIENVAGMPFERFLRAEILSPLKMRDSGMARSGRPVRRLVRSYTLDTAAGSLNEDEAYLPENYFAAAAMYSTAADLLKFDAALFTGRLLRPKTAELMLRFYPELGYTAYGLWGSDGYGNFAERFYYRTGGILGSTSNWIRTMATKKTIIVMSNTNAADLFALSEKLYLASIGTK